MFSEKNLHVNGLIQFKSVIQGSILLIFIYLKYISGQIVLILFFFYLYDAGFLVPQPGIEPMAPAVEAENLNLNSQ